MTATRASTSQDEPRDKPDSHSVPCLVTRLLQVRMGPAALFVALAIFVFLDLPSLGATYTAGLLPSFWRFLNHFWLGAETANAERSILYFGGLGAGADLLRLFAWTGVTVALLILLDTWKLDRQREYSVVASAVGP